MSMVLPWSHLSQRYALRSEQGLLRSRTQRSGPQVPIQRFIDESAGGTGDGPGEKQLLSFCSNDYLGLASHPQVISALQRGARQYGVGSGGSHMVTGHCRVHDQLEEALAGFLQRDRVLLFSCGYMANTGIINALMDETGVVFQDALNHASLLDGGWLCRASSERYPHADAAALETMLAQSDADHRLVVTDGLFSMDGDVAPLDDLIRLSRARNTLLMVDDAHGIGTLGVGGRGVLECPDSSAARINLMSQHEVPLLVGTLGKAFGTAGAFVAGDEALIEYLMQFTRSYVFTTALPPALAEATLTSLSIVQNQVWRRQRLVHLVARFREAATACGLTLLPSNSPIQAIMIGDAGAAVKASQWLAELGLHVPAIRPPTVPANSARLRVTFSAGHSDADMDRLIDALAVVSDRLAQERDRQDCKAMQSA